MYTKTLGPLPTKCSRTFSMKRSGRELLLFKIFENGFAIFASVLFAWNSYLAFNDYLQENTSLNGHLSPETELALPAMTICPKDLYKEIDIDATKMLMNISSYTYNLDDIFGSWFFKTRSKWNISEVFSTGMGRCFSLKLREKITDSSKTFIDFKPNKTFKVS